jgi:hypothetical protein
MSNDKKKKLARMIAGRMSQMTSEQLDAARSTTGQVKGFLTQDTLYRLRQVVADHQRAGDDERPDIRSCRAMIIVGLCDEYLRRHGAETDARAKAKVASVEEIKAEAMLERGRRQAEARYLHDAYAGANPETTKSTTPLVRQSELSLVTAIPHTQALARGEKDDRGRHGGFTQATLDLIKKYDLTEAEVLAVKLYSSDDYQYMNPASANNESYMKAENFSGDRWTNRRMEGTPEQYLGSAEGRKHLKQLFEEGSLHGAMAIAALQKLPPMAGTCYRGSRLTEAEYTQQYVQPNGQWPETKLTKLTSIATDRGPAEEFAKRTGPRSDATVSVITVVDVHNARDIGDLSIQGRREKEWLLLPGAVLQTESVQEVTDKNKKWTENAKCVLVKVRQVS